MCTTLNGEEAQLVPVAIMYELLLILGAADGIAMVHVYLMLPIATELAYGNSKQAGGPVVLGVYICKLVGTVE